MLIELTAHLIFISAVTLATLNALYGLFFDKGDK